MKIGHTPKGKEPLRVASLAACAMLLFTKAHGQAPQEPAVAERKEAAQTTPAFSPEAEKKLKELQEKLKEAVAKFRSERMDANIAQIAKLTGLDEAGIQALKEPAKKAAELSAEKTAALMDELLRKQYRQMPEQLEENLDQIAMDPEQMAQSGGIPGETQAEEESVWTEAVQKTLSPEQFATFRKAEDERIAELRKQIEGVVKVSMEWIQKQHEEYLQARSAAVKQGLKLTEERIKKLDDAARNVSEITAKDWQDKLEKLLMAMPEQSRRQIIKQGRYYVGMDEDSTKKANELWDKQIQELLSPEEFKKLSVADAEDKTTRVRALGLVLISMLDEQVAFTREQREKLRPIAEKLASEEKALFPQPTAQYFSINTATFFSTAGRATDEQLAPILTKQQITRWREACEVKRRNINVQVNRGINQPKKDEPVPLITPEEVEGIISDFFMEREADERKRQQAEAMLKAEDAARVVSLTPEAVEKLKLAAHGATEVGMANWRDNAERNIRSQLGNLNPQQIRQRLDSMESYQFYYGRNSHQIPVWDNTVKQVLTPEQQAAWQTEVDHRAAFRREAAAAAIMAEFDRKYSASAEQTVKLEAFLTKFLEQYAPDIEGMFSSSNSVPWYLQTYSMFLPFGSLDEKKFLEYMTKEQWERLKGSNEYSNATNYWENVEQQHKQRVKQKDESKKPS